MSSRINLSLFLKGCKLALPIFAGYIPLGITCGVLCNAAGLNIFESTLMSVLVFAGAGQYIAAGMIASLASPISIILTVMIVNLRHILYTSSLYPYVREWSPLKKALFAAEITDETFALHSMEMKKTNADHSLATGINVFSHLGWVLGTFIGAFAGSFIKDYKALGLDFALPALFIALLTPKLTDRASVAAAVLAGGGALFFAANQIGGGIIFASVVASSVALFISEVKDA